MRGFPAVSFAPRNARVRKRKEAEGLDEWERRGNAEQPGWEPNVTGNVIMEVILCQWETRGRSAIRRD
jgi:hypothetical protein